MLSRSATRCVRALHTCPPLSQAKKPAGGKSAPAAAAPTEVFDLKTTIPTNLLKTGPEPTYQPESAYPAWLFPLLDPPKLLSEHVLGGLANVPPEDMKRVFRLANKKRIKDANDAARKIK